MKKYFFQLVLLFTVTSFLTGSIKAQASNSLIESKASVLVNGEKLRFTHPILIDNGSILLPMRAYFEAIGAVVSWDQPTKTATALRNGKKIDLTINALTAKVNGQSYTLPTPAILHNGLTYIPLRFVGESFGGTVTWHQSTNTAEIQFSEGGSHTLTSKVLPIQNGVLPVPLPVQNSKFADDRRLLISDNPERLSSKTVRATETTLASDFVKATNKRIAHRIFGWHINELGKAATIGITIENQSTTNTLTVSTITDAAFRAAENRAVQEIGLPIAESTLLNKVHSSNKQALTIAPGQSKVLTAMQLDNSQLIGFVSDLNILITGSGEAQYAIRTVVSTDAKVQLETIRTPVVTVDSYANHPRGVWASTQIKAELPAYKTNSGQVGYSISNGKTDHLYTKENSLTTPEQTVVNPGHFGANYKLEIPIINDTNKRKGIILKLTGRGGTYSGVLKYRGQTYIIPPIQAGTQYVQLPVYYTTKKESTIELEFIHAGGSNLPLAIYIETK